MTHVTNGYQDYDAGQNAAYWAWREDYACPACNGRGVHRIDMGDSRGRIEVRCDQCESHFGVVADAPSFDMTPYRGMGAEDARQAWYVHDMVRTEMRMEVGA